MYRVARLDLVCTEWLIVLEDTAGIYKALAVCWDVFVVLASELVLELQDGGGLWESEIMGALGGCGLYFEADHVGALWRCACLFGHVAHEVWLWL